MPPNAPSSRPAVAVTGYGLVTPLGHSSWENFAALLNGRTLTSRSERLPEEIAPLDLVRALGCVADAQYASTDPAIALAERAAGEALYMADPEWTRRAFDTGAVTGGKANRPTIDAIIGSSKGAVHALTAAANKVGHVRPRPLAGPAPADAHLAVALGPHGYLLHHLHQRLPLGNTRASVAACASSLTALHEARLALQRPGDASRPRRILVVTSEAALLPMFVHSYARLGVLPPLTREGYRPRPLDQSRSGFMLTEIAAAVVLEAVDEIAPGQIELVDTAIAAESVDVIRTAPGMPALARIARQLLGAAPSRDGDGERIDLLHPHATGTIDNDPAELAVYADALAGQAPPDVYAHKGALGHGLGAAGLVSFVLACLCARAGRRPPMPWLERPIASPLRPAASAPPGKITRQAIFAAGFGGHVAGAVIRRG